MYIYLPRLSPPVSRLSAGLQVGPGTSSWYVYVRSFAATPPVTAAVAVAAAAAAAASVVDAAAAATATAAVTAAAAVAATAT